MNDFQHIDAIRSSQNIIHIHGHRGARGIFPENTMKGFEFTLSIGVNIIELDILVTADGIPVITHNPRLMAASTREKDGSWLENDSELISKITFSELENYDIGGLREHTEYGARYPEQAFFDNIRVPKFSDLCEYINKQEADDIWLNVEIKSDPRHPENTPPIPQFVEKILTPIRDAGLEMHTILQSFDWRVVHECERQAPNIARSYLSYAPKQDAPMATNVYEGSPWMDGLSLAANQNCLPLVIARANGQVWSPYHEDLTVSDMAVAREQGLIVNVWTVNELEDIDRMIALQVDGIITDYPGRVQRRLQSHGLDWRVSRSASDAGAVRAKA